MLSFYKVAEKTEKTKYLQGKEDAFHEVIKLLQGFKLARDIKHVPISQFY